MQNYSVNIDSNNVRNDKPYPHFLYLNQKNSQDTILKLKSDSIKQNNFFATKYLIINKVKTINQTYSPTIFSNHLLVAKDKQSTEMSNHTYYDCLLLVHLLGFILFTWVIVYFRKRLNQIFNSLFSNRAINQLIRDGDLLKEVILIPLMSIYFITITLFILYFFKYYYNLHQPFLIYLYFFLNLFIMIITLFSFNVVLSRFISNIFKNQDATYYYLLNSYISNIIIGLLFLPLLFLFTFSDKIISDKILIICIIIIIFINLIRIIKNIISGINYSKFSSLYLFLYLCTIEFLPIILLIKLVNGLVSF